MFVSSGLWRAGTPEIYALESVICGYTCGVREARDDVEPLFAKKKTYSLSLRRIATVWLTVTVPERETERIFELSAKFGAPRSKNGDMPVQ